MYKALLDFVLIKEQSTKRSDQKGWKMRFITKENIAIFLILIVVISRLVPHPPNFTPVLSIALFAGAMFPSKWKAFLIPVAGLILSNFLLGFYAVAWVVVGLMIVITAMGLLMKTNKSAPRWIGYSLGASVFFFIVSNFFVWVFSGYYPMTPAGLLTNYELALPFFQNTLVSTLFYSLILFEGVRFLEMGANKYLRAQA